MKKAENAQVVTFNDNVEYEDFIEFLMTRDYNVYHEATERDLTYLFFWETNGWNEIVAQFRTIWRDKTIEGALQDFNDNLFFIGTYQGTFEQLASEYNAKVLKGDNAEYFLFDENELEFCVSHRNNGGFSLSREIGVYNSNGDKIGLVLVEDYYSATYKQLED